MGVPLNFLSFSLRVWSGGTPPPLFGKIPNFFPLFFLRLPLGAHAKILNLTINPYRVLSNGTPNTNTKKINTKNSGLRLSDTACTAPLGPKCHFSTLYMLWWS